MAAHRSFSAVKSLRSCGEMYRLERVEQVSQQPSAAATAGRVIHEVTELIDLEIAAGETDEGTLTLLAHTMAADVLPREIEHNLSADYPTEDSFRSFGRGVGQNVEWYRKVGIPRALANYINWRLNNDVLETMTLPSGELAIEISFEIVIAGADPIKGQIDRVFINRDTGVPLVLDIKSGVKPKSTEQLGVYRQALLAGGIDVTYGAYLYGLKNEAKLTPDINLSYWTPQRLSAIYGQADFIIKEGLFLPNPGDSCFMCSVSRHCEFYQSTVF